MDANLAVLADFASLTREGKVNILGIFDSMSPGKMPASVPIFYLVVIFEAGPAEVGQQKEIEIVLTDQDGDVKARLAQTVTVEAAVYPGVRRKINQIIGLAGLKFDQAGTYQFAILVGGEEKTTVPLHILPAREEPNNDNATN